MIRLVVGDKMRPTEVASAAGLAYFVVAPWAPPYRVLARIGTYVAPVDETGWRVHRDPIWVAVTHRVDLRSGLRRARREEVSLGDGVGTVGLGVDADDLAAQVVGVRG